MFVVFPGRNMMIIESLGDKFEVYEQQSDNVHIKELVYNDSNLQFIHENYYKDNDLRKYVLTNPEADIKVTQYFYQNEIKQFIEEPEGKRLIIESRENNIEAPTLMNYFYIDSLINRFFMSMDYKITTGEVNGKECYVFTKEYANPEKIEKKKKKDTGLVLQDVQIESTEEVYRTQYEYSFGTVTDEDMQEPDATQYRLTENN